MLLYFQIPTQGFSTKDMYMYALHSYKQCLKTAVYKMLFYKIKPLISRSNQLLTSSSPRCSALLCSTIHLKISRQGKAVHMYTVNPALREKEREREQNKPLTKKPQSTHRPVSPGRFANPMQTDHSIPSTYLFQHQPNSNPTPTPYTHTHSLSLSP